MGSAGVHRGMGERDLHGDQQTVATGFAYLRLRARWPWVAMAMRAEGVNLRG